jgi:alanine-glyoxylate transaminase/serine-glyoxylate transaminase/serine-pyruvate transaminase
MTVRAGREFLAIPGPTVIPDEVLRAMHRPAIDIYSGELLGITDSLMRDLPTLFGTKGRAYVYISNGHGAWEGALTNVLSRGDKILVLESGRFAAGWGEFAARLGVEVESIKAGWRRAVRPDEVEARLRKDTTGEIKAILVTQVDTASKRSARRSRRRATRACSWSTWSPRSAACRSRWTHGASTLRSRARRRA